jgi:hypothetical protein
MRNDHINQKNKTMKKTIVAMAGFCTLLAFNANAQFERGTIMLGANIGSGAFTSANSDYVYDNASTRSTKTTGYSFSGGPQLGVFIGRNVAVGGTFSYTVSDNTTNTTLMATTGTSGGKTTSTNYTVNFGPFVRCYFANHPARNLLYLQAGARLGTGYGNSSGNGYSPTTTYNTTGSQSNINTWDASGTLGLTHFFYRHIGMDFYGGYTYSHSRSDNANATNTMKDSNGVVTTSTNNYSLATATSGITLGVTFHWFLEGGNRSEY